MAGGAAAPPAPSAPGSSPPPAAAPAAACSSRALGQRRRQLPEPETMLLRHPHAVPSNALQREDGRREKGSEGAEGRAALLQRREGPGRRGLAQGPGGAAHGPPRDPSLPPPPQSERPRPGCPGPGTAWPRALTPCRSGPASPAPFFCLLRGGFGIPETPLDRAALWNVGKGHPPCSSPQGLPPPHSRPGGTNIPPAKFGSSHIPKGTGNQTARGGQIHTGRSRCPQAIPAPRDAPQLHTAIKMEETPEIKPNNTGEQRLLPLQMHPRHLQATPALCSQEASRMPTRLWTVTSCATSDTLGPLARAVSDPQAKA